jgi:NADPH:quinone reductase-like Zn-dependent oxidoreductase
LVIEDVPTPSPDRGQVLVKIEGAGFCHSDIHVIDGKIRVLPARLSRSATRMPGALSPWVQESDLLPIRYRAGSFPAGI